MSDPYQILNISPAATEDEISQAYRKLAKKYHPDLNPGNKEAEKKMREINAAYEQIRTQQYGGASYEHQSGGGNPFGGTYGSNGANGGSYSRSQSNPFEDGPFASGSGFDPFDIFNIFTGGQGQQRQTRQQRPTSPKMQAVYNFLQHQQYDEALRVLSDTPERDAEWYYYSALANAGKGNRVTALSHARDAVRYDPDNEDYQILLEQFEQGSFEYSRTGQDFGFGMNGPGSAITRLCLAFSLFSCLCRPFCCVS